MILPIIKNLPIYRYSEIFFIFVLPVLLILFGVVPIEKRGFLLLVVGLVLMAIIFKEKWSLKDLGLRTDNLKQSLLPYLIFTICGTLGIVLLAKILGRSAVVSWWEQPHFQYRFLIMSILQEFAFRGFLIPRLKLLFTSSFNVIAVNALLFAFIHLVFPQPLLLLSLGILGGISFAAMYYKYPNLVLITISHTIFNFLAVLFCFFSLNQSC